MRFQVTNKDHCGDYEVMCPEGDEIKLRCDTFNCDLVSSDVYIDRCNECKEKYPKGRFANMED